MSERLCICGCGKVPPIAKRTYGARGVAKGERLLGFSGHRRRRQGTPPESRFWKYVQKSDGCWLWTGARDKRRRYGLFRANAGKPMQRAHRWSWEMANGPIPDGLGVLHSCDVPQCVRPDHLFLGTQLDNMRDCSQKGRMPRGEERRSAKLNESSVREIRALVASGSGIHSVARDYGVADRTVRAIVLRLKWKWVA